MLDKNIRQKKYCSIRASNQFKFNYTYPAVGTTSRAYNVPKPPKPDDYCDIDITNKTSRTGGSRKRNPTKVRTVKLDENLICSNFNCRVTNSPMWRKGPLGPKSLCNRCGIRYRKMKMKEEMEREGKRASEVKALLASSTNKPQEFGFGV
ncbi:hypothetical protein C1H46_012321 [Malus baccata]|uniref:GATA-type domain-containing protein n=1 Tax=Malus baccata TaxID=106549 RepID=A0A540MT95_MALBA|nr:hypothetical protein C1H46_012321 [Malus baccata]